MIIVRSVVPGGIAQVDGQLLPGDRIMYVNDISLDTHTSLDCAVQALKGAPFGPVRIGIARPINTEDDSNPLRDTRKNKDNNSSVKTTENRNIIKDDNEASSNEKKPKSISMSRSVSSTKSTITTASITSYSATTTTERSERGSASDTFAESSNLSDWKTDYGVRLHTELTA